MIVYCLLLLPVAVIAYFLGSMDTIALASNFVFRIHSSSLESALSAKTPTPSGS